MIFNCDCKLPMHLEEGAEEGVHHYRHPSQSRR